MLDLDDIMSNSWLYSLSTKARRVSNSCFCCCNLALLTLYTVKGTCTLCAKELQAFCYSAVSLIQETLESTQDDGTCYVLCAGSNSFYVNCSGVCTSTSDIGHRPIEFEKMSV